MAGVWQFWIDRGGTFTDIVARHPDGRLSSHKYLSDNPERYRDAAVYAMREIMGLDDDAPFPAEQVHAIKMGTTVATNALLERKGARTLLLISEGFTDALEIGQQHRPDLFALVPERPAVLYEQVIPVTGRLDAEGAVRTPLDEATLRSALATAREAGLEAVAVALLHSYRNPEHEQRVEHLAREAGFQQISLSSQISPTIKLVPRGDTAVADAYLSPVLNRYIRRVAEQTGGAPLYFMQSSGGLASADSFHGRDAILSGPAGGIVGAAATGTRAGITNLIAFDMGGTSTDVSHYAGAFERVNESRVAGLRFSIPMIDIQTVAAGGGSICSIEDGRFRVGPQSAGANPGPAAYGRGGPITVTDCNILLGKLQPDLFPHVFGPEADQPLDRSAVEAGFRTLQAQLAAETGLHKPPEDVAEGFLAVAVEHMARAIKRVSVERGHNIKEYALLTFGGAGGQHACLVADALGMTRVLIPPFAGVLSALGMGLADQRVLRVQGVDTDIENRRKLDRVAGELELATRRALEAQGVSPVGIRTEVRAHVKVAGTDTPLTIPYEDATAMALAFRRSHREQFGFSPTDHLVVDAMEVEAWGGGSPSVIRTLAADTVDMTDAETLAPVDIYTSGKWQAAPVVRRSSLSAGDRVTGPAILVEENSTTLVEPGWSAYRQTDGSLLLERRAGSTGRSARADSSTHAKEADPILLEVFNNLFMSVAEEMGGILAKTAHSVNVKERLDFSCAVFDAGGGLVANAPHMPVHLGSMGASVRAVAEARRGTMYEGDAYAVNDPYAGGTHLPDITVISPVMLEGRSEPDYFVASRGHHADVGGIAPGSMPSFSQSIEEEGARLVSVTLVAQDEFDETAVRRHLTEGSYPARNPDQNIADLKAQIAANTRGIRLLHQLCERYGMEVVQAYMEHVKANAEEAVRRVLGKLRGGKARYPMDCGGEIVVALTVDRKARSMTVDFTGTSDQLEGNFNAPLAVTRAAVLYVLRLLTGKDIPLNDGCLTPVTLIVPEGSMLNPRSPAAVVAGNVETSQAVVNALLIAAGASAASQGTMNNLTFGNARYQYYETLAGGTGAAPGQPGAHAIHSHMTNSRLTDVEVVEKRYPVRIDQFGIRRGSGGGGAAAGGDGLVRAFTFLEPMTVSILASHRTFGPPGLMGGAPGAPGSNQLVKASGERVMLRPSDQIEVRAGDQIVLETPGGGGYGLPDEN